LRLTQCFQWLSADNACPRLNLAPLKQPQYPLPPRTIHTIQHAVLAEQSSCAAVQQAYTFP